MGICHSGDPVIPMDMEKEVKYVNRVLSELEVLMNSIILFYQGLLVTFKNLEDKFLIMSTCFDNTKINIHIFKVLTNHDNMMDSFRLTKIEHYLATWKRELIVLSQEYDFESKMNE